MKTFQRVGCRIIALALLSGALPLSGIAQNYLILQDGRRMDAQSVRYQPRTREYIVVADRGTFPIPEAQVREVHVATPEAWNQGLQLMRAQRYDDAVSVFRNIERDYEMLNWDIRARGMLAQAYTGQGEHVRAIATYEKLFQEITPTSQQRRAYWQSLLAAERFTTLRTELDETIAAGDREDAAAAHLQRGKMHQAEGNTMEALFDYLRTHILYEAVTEVQPEALHLAAQRLDELRDPRAEELRTRLRQRYPNSEFARRPR